MPHHMLEWLRGLLVHYGYWAVAGGLLLENAGVPVPGETILLLASFLAFSEQTLQLRWIIVMGTVAATIGDNLGFLIGFFGGRPLLDHYRRFFHIQAATLAQGERIFARYGALTVFFARFVFGMRIITGPLAGVLRMPWRKFLLFNFLGAVLWVTIIAWAGYLFGRQWQRLVQDLKVFDIAVVIAAALVILFLGWRQRRGVRGN